MPVSFSASEKSLHFKQSQLCFHSVYWYILTTQYLSERIAKHCIQLHILQPAHTFEEDGLPKESEGPGGGGE